MAAGDTQRHVVYHSSFTGDTAIATDSQTRRDADPLRFDEPPIGPRVRHARRHLPPELVEDARVLATLRRIEAAFPTEPTLVELAEPLKLSPFHLHRLFADVMGETVNGYIRRVRLDTAAILLLSSPQTVQEIAAWVCYGSLAAFNHAFRRQFGASPTQYRDAARAAVIHITDEHHARAKRVCVETQSALSLIGVRFHGGYDQVEYFWARFATLVRECGIEPDGLQAYGLVRDNPQITPDGLIRYFCMVADPGLPEPLPALLERHTLTPGRYASLRHDGPYADIFPSYVALSPVWLRKHQQRFDMAPALERYEAPPWQRVGGDQSVTVMIKLL